MLPMDLPSTSMATTNKSEGLPKKETEDRLSDLPDGVIHHILSFLDAKFAVRTCVLSKRWLGLWSSVPVLNFDSGSFRNNVTFNKFVRRALSGRRKSEPCDLIGLKFHSLSRDKSVLGRVIRYAVTHFVQEISLKHNLNYLTDQLLCCVTLRRLRLEQCQLFGDHFSRCMNLETLTLVKCYMLQDEKIRISAPRLVKLSICNSEDRFFVPKLKVVISCPRLNSFWFEGRCPEVSPSLILDWSMDGCPVLERMEIRIYGSYKKTVEALGCCFWLQTLLEKLILHSKSLVVRKDALMINTILRNDDVHAIVHNDATADRGEGLWRPGNGQDFGEFVTRMVNWFDDQIWIEESTPGEFAAVAEAELSDMESQLVQMVSLLQGLGIQVPEEEPSPSDESRETFEAKYLQVQLQKQRIKSTLERHGIPASDSWKEIQNRFLRYRAPDSGILLLAELINDLAAH